MKSSSPQVSSPRRKTSVSPRRSSSGREPRGNSPVRRSSGGMASPSKKNSTDVALQESTSRANSLLNISSSTPTQTPSKGNPPSSGSQSYLSRKAHHRFSSLKKKKPSSSQFLLNKLFCNSNPSQEEGITSTPSKDTVSGSDDGGVCGNEIVCADNKADAQGCVSSAITDATDALQLDREASVRKTIQTSMMDAQAHVMDVVCGSRMSGTGSSSPPTSTIKNDERQQPGDDGTTEPKKTGGTVGFDLPPTTPATSRGVMDKGSSRALIPTPYHVSILPSTLSDEDYEINKTEDSWDRDSMQISRSSSTDKPLEMKDLFGLSYSSPAPKAASEKQIAATPGEASTATSQFQTPTVEDDFLPDDFGVGTGLVPTPTPFKLNPKASPMTSAGRSLLKDSPSVSPTKSPVSSSIRSPKAFSASQVEERILLALATAKKEWEEQRKNTMTIEEVEKKIAAAVEESRKEQEKSGSDDGSLTYTLEKVQHCIDDALKSARNEWEAENNQKIEQVLSECKSQAEQTLQQYTEQWREEHASELERLEAQYKRKIDEQKDQALMARRLAKQHQAELEQMEAKMAEIQAQPNHLKQQVEELQRQKDALESKFKDETHQSTEIQEAQRKQLKDLEEQKREATSRLSRFEKEKGEQVAAVRAMQDKLQSARDNSISPSKKRASSPSKSSSKPSRQEAENLRKQVTELRRELEALQSRIDPKEETRALQAKHAAQVLALESKLEAAQNQVAELQKQSAAMNLVAEEKKDGSLVECDIAVSESTLRQALEEKDAEIAELRKKIEANKDVSKFSPIRQTNSKEESFTKARLELASLRRELDKVNRDRELEVAELKKEIKLLSEKVKREQPGTPGRHSIGSPGRPSPARAAKTPPRNKNDELHEREKEVLRRQIGVLEEQVQKLSSEHKKAMDDLRRRGEQDLADIKQEMENRVEKYMQAERDLKETLATVDSADKEELLEKIEQLESEKKSDRSGGLREVQKKEELLKRIASLEKKEKSLMKEQQAALQEVRAESDAEIRRLEKEIEKQKAESLEKERELKQAISETESFEKEELLQRIDKLEGLLESERSAAVLVKMKVGNMEKDAKAAEESHLQELNHLQSSLEEEIKRLSEEQQNLSAVEEAMQIATNEKEILEEELNLMNKKMVEERHTIHDKMEELRKHQAEEIDLLRRGSTEKLQSQEKEFNDKISTLEKQLVEIEEQKAVLENRQGLTQDDEQKLRDDLARAQDRLELDKKAHEARVAEIRADNIKETEEILSQLNVVEKEHREKMANLEKTCGEKDAIITALGSQLAAAQSRSKIAEETQKELNDDLENSRIENTRLSVELEKVTDEFSSLKESFERFKEESEASRQKACDEAREEMIERAEVQFKQANDLYVKLKKQYDLTRKKMEAHEKELKEAKTQLEKVESSEIDLKTQIAELKAESAKVEAESAKKSKEYRREMERLLQAAEGFEKKCQAAEASSRAAYKKLNSITAEKEKLQKEHDEVKSVCEELMAMVEGQHHEC